MFERSISEFPLLVFEIESILGSVVVIMLATLKMLKPAPVFHRFRALTFKALRWVTAVLAGALASNGYSIIVSSLPLGIPFIVLGLIFTVACFGLVYSVIGFSKSVEYSSGKEGGKEVGTAPNEVLARTRWSVGAHLVVRLLTAFSVVIATVLIALYSEFGVLGLTTVIGVSGISILGILGFFGTTWDKVKEPLTERLEYLNEHAFSPLAEWGSSIDLGKINPNVEVASNALAALETHRRYMTVGLYTKSLLHLVEKIDKNTREYERLWKHLYDANMNWIQDGTHLSQWARFSTMPDMAGILLILDLNAESAYYNPPQELRTLVSEFLENNKKENAQEVNTLVELHRDFREKKPIISTMLDAYMRTNMLHRMKGS